MELVTVLFWFSQYAYVPYMSPHLRGLGATATLVGMVAGVYGFVQLCCRIPIGVVMGKKNLYKLAVLLGCACAAVAGLGIWLTDNPYLVLVFRAVSGLGSSMWAGFAILYTAYFAEGETTRSMGKLNFYQGTGRLFAFLLGGLVADLLGYHQVFLLCCITGLLGTVCSLFLGNEQISAKQPTVKEMLTVLSSRALIVLGLLSGVHQMMINATSFSFVSDIAKELGASSWQLSFVLAVVTIAHITACNYLEPLVCFFGERKILSLCFVGMGVYCVANLYAPNIYVLFLVQIIGGVSAGIPMALFMAMSIRDFPQELQSTAMSVYQAIYGAGMTIGPLFMGILVDGFGYRTSFWAYGFLGLAGAVACWFFLHTRESRQGA